MSIIIHWIVLCLATGIAMATGSYWLPWVVVAFLGTSLIWRAVCE